MKHQILIDALNCELFTYYLIFSISIFTGDSFEYASSHPSLTDKYLVQL